MSGEKLALRGRIVTMNADFDVLPDGVVYVDGDSIAFVQPAAAPVPAAFGGVTVTRTAGTLYPGLMELHNHLAYNALGLWNVPKLFQNRSQWPREAEYHELVTGPMGAVGASNDHQVLPALVRWVEAKCLLAGVTTSQGIRLASSAKTPRYFKGLVRNAESPSNKELLSAASRIPDVAARDWKTFDRELTKATERGSCMLLHLSEGLDAAARAHFTALKSGDAWALSSSMAGIHCAALEAADFDTMAANGAAMVWSPLSNYLLYGGTARIDAALKSGVRVALGSDWSPTGSKNLLGELKVARLVAHELELPLADRDLVLMVTRTAADILGWQKYAGSIEAGKLADFVVVRGHTGDAYTHLLSAKETDVALVMIGGTARFGEVSLLRALGVSGEALTIAGEARTANFHDPAADPEIEAVPLSLAKEVLSDVLANLPNLAARESKGQGARGMALRAEPPRVRLALDEQQPHADELRPRLPFDGRSTGSSGAELAASPVALKALTLDPLTVADDPHFAGKIAGQLNLPAFLKQGLSRAF
ncbi:MAG TPA: amidohydrolase family protein [Polyangiaceae bacterium]